MCFWYVCHTNLDVYFALCMNVHAGETIQLVKFKNTQNGTFGVFSSRIHRNSYCLNRQVSNCCGILVLVTSSSYQNWYFGVSFPQLLGNRYSLSWEVSKCHEMLNTGGCYWLRGTDVAVVLLQLAWYGCIAIISSVGSVILFKLAWWGVWYCSN